VLCVELLGQLLVGVGLDGQGLVNAQDLGGHSRKDQGPCPCSECECSSSSSSSSSRVTPWVARKTLENPRAMLRM